jgi:hypothetical protein
MHLKCELMLFIKNTGNCASHTKHMNALTGQNAEILYVKAGDIYSNCCALEGAKEKCKQ